MSLIDQFKLDNADQSGLSKMYVLVRLINYYNGGDNCMVDETGMFKQDLRVGVVDTTPDSRVPTVVQPPSTILLDITDINNGFIPHRDEAIPALEYYIMYTETPTGTRFGAQGYSNPPLPEHFICVNRESTTGDWFVQTQAAPPTAFTPDPTDRLLFGFDVSSPLPLVDFVGMNTTLSGIQQGYVSTDLVINSVNPAPLAHVISVGTFVELTA